MVSFFGFVGRLRGSMGRNLYFEAVEEVDAGLEFEPYEYIRHKLGSYGRYPGDLYRCC